MSFTKTQNKFSKGIDDKADDTAVTINDAGNVGIGIDPTTGTFDLSAKEQLKEWKTKAKASTWSEVTDGEFGQEPTEEAVAEWMETRAAGDKLQVAGNISATGEVSCHGRFSLLRDTTNYITVPSATGALNFQVGGVGGDNVVLSLTADRDAYFSGTVSATSPSNAGVPTSTIKPSVMLMGGSTTAGEGGELGFGSHGANNGFASIKGYVNDAQGKGTGHIDFYVRSDPNVEEMTRSLRLGHTGNATFSGSLSTGTVFSAGTIYGQYENTPGNEPSYFASWSGASTTTRAPVLWARSNGSGTVVQMNVAGTVWEFTNGGTTQPPTITLDTQTGNINGNHVRANQVIQDGAPVIDAKGLISTLSTLRNATKDETTLEGMRDALSDAIGGLIEKFEHQIATMPSPEPEASTMDLVDE